MLFESLLPAFTKFPKYLPDPLQPCSGYLYTMVEHPRQSGVWVTMFDQFVPQSSEKGIRIKAGALLGPIPTGIGESDCHGSECTVGRHHLPVVGHSASLPVGCFGDEPPCLIDKGEYNVA